VDPRDPRDSRPAGVADDADIPDGADVDRPEAAEDGSALPWTGVGAVVLVLVTGAFVSGWVLGRRWGRLMGW
jgi:hypothetical protein